MKKANLILISLLAVLGSASAWYFTTNQNTNLTGYDFEFAVQDTAAVYKIFLADRNGKKVTLTRLNNVDWQLDGKYKAQPNAVFNLLNTIKRVDLKYRLARNAVPNVVQDMAGEGIKVEIYNKNNDKLKVYYVGGSDADGYGTYMMLEGSNEPYCTHIPGFDGGLRPRYFTDTDDWRDRMIFTLKPEEIKTVSVDYPLQKANSFRLTNDGNNSKVEPFYSTTPQLQRPPTKGLVESYLSNYKFLGIEGFENHNEKRDSVKTTAPFAYINLVTKKGDSTKLTLYALVPKNSHGDVIQNEKGQVTVERYLTESSTGDWVLLQHYVWEKVFWGYPSFYTQR